MLERELNEMSKVETVEVKQINVMERVQQGKFAPAILACS